MVSIMSKCVIHKRHVNERRLSEIPASLQITVEPQDAYVIEGMSVTLCCGAEGTPPPDYYEWSALYAYFFGRGYFYKTCSQY